MLYIIIGAIGFVVVHIFDLVAIKRIPKLKPFVWCVGCGLLIYSLVMICRYPVKVVLPAWSTWLGWGVLAISATSLIHSLFISLPFRKTYVDTGVGDKLVKTGPYALVRHPGILWFPLFMLSLILISSSSLLLIAAPTFIALDIALVVIQDKFIFGRMFHGYERYRRETPMLLPNKKSISAFLRSFRQVKSQ
jgi:protein-S-isoprenylcysteine O-methyltransferase Ste14